PSRSSRKPTRRSRKPEPTAPVCYARGRACGAEGGMLDVDTSFDWASWAGRWEAQQQHHIPRREQRFQVMLELVGELVGPAPATVLDLACGPGSISRRVLQRFPDAHVVALDADPFLLEIGRRTLGDAGGRLQWIQADLRRPEWAESLRPFAPFDA